MRKSKRKIREPRESEKSFKVEYKSGVDNRLYWTVIHSWNKLEVEDLFYNKFYTDRSEILEDEKGNKNIFVII